MSSPHTHPTESDRTSNERAVSELLGTILLFGMLVALLTIVQANAVPHSNQRIEFEHQQRVQTDLVEFNEDLRAAVATGKDYTTVVETGTEYPNRMFLFNPSPVSGSIESTAGTVVLKNAQASGDVGDYLDGSDQSFDTTRITYQPGYNEYHNAPDTYLENGVVLNDFVRDGTVIQADSGGPIDGTRISLMAVASDLSVSRTGPTTLDIRPVSAPTRTVTVTDTGTPISLTLPTAVSTAQWEEILASELTTNGGHVQSVTDGPTAGTVTITLEPGITYELQTAKVGLGTVSAEEGPHYLTAVGGNTVTDTGRSGLLTAEVRDRFNAPVSGAEVTFDATTGNGKFVAADGTDLGSGPVTVTTGEDGRAAVQFDRTDPGVGEATVAATIGGSSAPEPNRERVEFTVTEPSKDRDVINPRAGGVALTSVSESGDSIVMEFTNLASEEKTLTQVRTNFFYSASPGQGAGSGIPATSRISYDSFVTQSPTMEMAGDFVDVPDVTFTTSETTDIEVRFYDDDAGTDPYSGPNSDDFFVITFLYDDGTTGTYFVQVAS